MYGVTRVLFISSPAVGGADTWVHHLVLKSLDRRRFEVHAAAQPPGGGTAGTSALEQLQGAPDLRLRPTDFGTGISLGKSRLRRAAEAAAVARSLVELAVYVRRHGIRI